MSGAEDFPVRPTMAQYFAAYKVGSLPEPTTVGNFFVEWRKEGRYSVLLQPDTREFRINVGVNNHVSTLRELAAVLLAADAYQKEWNLTHGK